MSKALELIRTLIDGANEYEKKTGNTNPTVYLSKNNLLIIEQALLKAQEQDAKFLDNLQRWFLLLGESGANTKYKVRDEMEAVIDELKEVLE